MKTSDAIERVTAMVNDTRGNTWDLSPNDTEALGLVLKEIGWLRSENTRLQSELGAANYTGPRFAADDERAKR